VDANKDVNESAWQSAAHVSELERLLLAFDRTNQLLECHNAALARFQCALEQVTQLLASLQVMVGDEDEAPATDMAGNPIRIS
jgi:hypothetical protein